MDSRSSVESMDVAARFAQCVQLRELRRALEQRGIDPDALLQRYEAIPARHRHRRRALLLEALPEEALEQIDASVAQMSQGISTSIHLNVSPDGQAFVQFRLDAQRPHAEAAATAKGRQWSGCKPRGRAASRLRRPQAVEPAS